MKRAITEALATAAANIEADLRAKTGHAVEVRLEQ
jgi:hypothetical protein